MSDFKQKEDTSWLDNLRVFATISVIFLHVAAPFVTKFGKISMPNWWWANTYDGLVRFCVPVFVMLTGALLLPRAHTLKAYLKNRLVRIVIPFAFWTAIYICHAIYEKPNNYNLTFIVDKLINGAAYHLWYIYMIIGIYLIIPIISTWIRKASEKEILYFLALWLISILATQPIISNYTPDFNLKYFSGFIGYLVLGHYLSSMKFENIKHIKLVSFSIFFAGVLLTIIGTYLLSSQKGKFIVDLYTYFSLNVVIAAIGIFLFFKQFTLKNKHLLKFRNFINRNSFGIYFVHILVLFYLNKAGINGSILTPKFGIFITTGLCLFCSCVIIHFLKKIPLGHKLVG
ncbi:acyltransferase [Pedobacter sp. UC225_61]|uniref:acyltransferase n=1 Tax=Pedobacter sp. UC225_61 TaxID=3374623 RepID=UPI00378CDD16